MEHESEGLCCDCRFAKRIETSRGARFLLCRRSESDPRYPRYPRLPVSSCPGHERGDTGSS
jgi:hypothetical protein